MRNKSRCEKTTSLGSKEITSRFSAHIFERWKPPCSWGKGEYKRLANAFEDCYSSLSNIDSRPFERETRCNELSGSRLNKQEKKLDGQCTSILQSFTQSVFSWQNKHKNLNFFLVCLNQFMATSSKTCLIIYPYQSITPFVDSFLLC